MRRFSHLLLLAALAAGVFASAASAMGLEITDEGSGSDHCESVSIAGTDVNGGCLIHVISEGEDSEPSIELRKHIVFGIEYHVTLCGWEFRARLDENGQGYALEQIMTSSTGGCVRRACTTDGTTLAEKEPWKVEAREGTAVEGTEYLAVDLCFQPHFDSTTKERCEIHIPFNQVSGTHQREFGHATEIPGEATGDPNFRCELVGHWQTESGGPHDGQPETEIGVSHVP